MNNLVNQFPGLLVQIIAKAIPIMIKSIVQTGPKIQFGGLNAGLLIVVYQPGILGVVKSEPIALAKNTMAMEIMYFRYLDIRQKFFTP